MGKRTMWILLLLGVMCAADGWAMDIFVSPAAVGGTGTKADPADLPTAFDMALNNGQADRLFLQTGVYDGSAGDFSFDTTGGPADGLDMTRVLVASGKPVAAQRQQLAEAGVTPDHEAADLSAAVDWLLAQP